MHSRAVIACLVACLANTHALMPGSPIGVDASAIVQASHPAFRNETRDAVNAANAGWVASDDQPEFIRGLSLAQAKGLMGAKKMYDESTIGAKTDAQVGEEEFPPNFDSSVKWAQCPTIMQIRDQSACGSCWAFGAAEAMSDRYCTIGKQTTPVKISAGDLMSCCSSCGNGCEGGYPIAAWQYWVQNGLPDNTCDPYPFPKCAHHVPASPGIPKCPKAIYPTPACDATCSGTPKGGAPKKHFGSSAYRVIGEKAYMKEIMENGPIEVAFSVYEDFLHYKKGVYRHTSGQLLGGHAVKMIGWGTTASGTKYWIVNNSWNSHWGNKGQFWILRGVDECGIENSGAAGAPKV